MCHLLILITSTLTVEQSIFTVHGVTKALRLDTGPATFIPVYKLLVHLQVQVASANIVIFLVIIMIIYDTAANLID